LGEEGLGKSLSIFKLSDFLIKNFWIYISKNEDEYPDYLPLFIRPILTEWTYSLLNGPLFIAIKKFSLHKIPLIILIDGYDELKIDVEPINLVNHLGLFFDNSNNYDRYKLIISCRPDKVNESDLNKYFNFNNQLEIYYLLPCKIDQ